MNTMDDGASGKGTTLWKLCNRAWDIFKEHLYRIPGNGKITRLWEDKIMGLQPLNFVPDYANLHVWLIQHGVQMLADISSWDTDGNWLAWAIPRPPDNLQAQLISFHTVLSGSAPVHLRLSDKLGWGKTGAYTTSFGFTALQSQHLQIHSPSLWQLVWEPFGLPKINFFCWVLMRKRVLTGENLAKRGIFGPHRCPVYNAAQETIDHLFIDCPYTQEV